MKRLVFLEGVAILIGTIIGSGYLTLPYSFLRAGVGANVFWFIFFILFINLLHIIYAEVVLATKANHRLPGYASLYIGRFAGTVSTLSFILGVFGGLLVYLILGVHFLGKLLEPLGLGEISSLALTLVFWLVATSLLFLNFKFSSRLNFYITLVTVSLFILISLFSLFRLDPANFKIAPQASLFFPFGLILYSLVGSLAVPEIVNLLKLENQPVRIIKSIIIVGTLVPALVYFLFGLGIFSASGINTSQDALSGLIGRLPMGLIFLGFLMAFLEIITSYFTFEVYTYQTLKNDFNFKKALALGLVAVLPLAFVAVGVNDFLKLMAIMGSVLVSLDSITIVLAYLLLPRKIQGYKYQLVRLSPWAGVLVILMFVLGGALGLVYAL